MDSGYTFEKFSLSVSLSTVYVYISTNSFFFVFQLFHKNTGVYLKQKNIFFSSFYQCATLFSRTFFGNFFALFFFLDTYKSLMRHGPINYISKY